MKIISTAAFNEGRMFTVVTETNERGAAIMLTQGLQPGFKPRTGPPIEYAPGRGIDAKGTYVSFPNAFSKGSFGNIRLVLQVRADQLDVSPEQKQLGVTRLEDCLNNEDGAVTKTYIPTSQVTAVEIYDHAAHEFHQLSPAEARKRLQIDENTPALPTVEEYQRRLQPHAERLYLSPQKLDDAVHRYKMAPLEHKMELAKELDEIEMQKTAAIKTSSSEQETLSVIRSRINQQAYQAYLKEMDNPDDDEELEYYLRQELSITVNSDGTVDFWKLDPESERLLQGIPVIVYHHTTSRLLKKIMKEGLRSDVKKRSNPYLNSGQGVYVTTETVGNAVWGYQNNATQTHGGDPVTLKIKTTVDQLRPDVDDEDISSGQVQFILDYVPPQDISVV